MEAAVEVVDLGVGSRRPDDLRHAVVGETVALDGAGEFLLRAAAVVDLALERAVGRAEFGGAFAHADFQFVLGGAQFLLDALAFVVLAAEVAVALGELGGAFADGALDAGARIFDLGLAFGQGVHRLVAPDAAEDQENVLEHHPGDVFKRAPSGVGRPHAEHGRRPVHPAHELVGRHHDRRRHQHAPVAVERQERQRAENVEVHLRPAAREMDEQPREQHLPDGHGVTGQRPMRAPEDAIKWPAREDRPEHGGDGEFHAHPRNVGDRRMAAGPLGQCHAGEPFEHEEHGEHPVLAPRQGGTFAAVELFAALLDESGVGLHGQPRRTDTPHRRFTEMRSKSRSKTAIKKEGRGTHVLHRLPAKSRLPGSMGCLNSCDASRRCS